MQRRYPFKFLDAYTREDRPFFFGREEEISALYEMVFQSDLILLYGASGTGKTSLIKCGLAGQFQSHDWLDLYIRRGSNINESLRKALDKAGGKLDGADEDLSWIQEDFFSESEVATEESELATSIRAIYLTHFKPVYLIFDQLEELYILGNELEQRAFIDSVKELLKVEQPVKLILSIREEYLGFLYELEKAIPDLLRKKLRVEPMNLNKIKRVIRQVGESPKSNIQLASGQEEKIGQAIFEKIKGEEKKLNIPLPYLQVFLDEFYLKVSGDESREAEAVFSLQALDQMEDIDDVLRSFLDEQVLAIAQKYQRAPEELWKILSPFVTLEGTKDPLALADVQSHSPAIEPALLSELLEEFQKRRILRYTEQDGHYEVAHDSLAQQIHAKRDDSEIAKLELRRLIKSQMALKSSSRAYLSEGQLKLVDLYKGQLSLNTEEQAYLNDSREEVRRQYKAKKRRSIILRISALLIIAILSVITLWALQQKKQADLATNKAKEQKTIANERLETIVRNQKINAAAELMLFGDSYSDLKKIKEANATYRAALNSLGEIRGSLRDTLLYKIEHTQ